MVGQRACPLLQQATPKWFLMDDRASEESREEVQNEQINIGVAPAK
jgi:hypothetical protein